MGHDEHKTTNVIVIGNQPTSNWILDCTLKYFWVGPVSLEEWIIFLVLVPTQEHRRWDGDY
jgi:hypothetical protein